MLAYFSAKNFKQFESIELDFTNVREYGFNTANLTSNKKLLKTMLIYGPNASGKSNFGYALFDIVQHLVDKQTRPLSYLYYLNADSPTEAAEFSYTFIFNRRKITYTYAKLDRLILVAEQLTVNGERVFSWDKRTSEKDFSNLKKF